MSLTLTLPVDLEERLKQEAKRQGVPPAEYALRILNTHLTPPNGPTGAVALLQSWIDEGDPEEQKQTGDYLVRALDEDRPSNRKLFPPDLEGVTW